MPWGRAFVIFFLPGGGALPRFSCPTPGNCQLKEKKSANAWGLPGGGGWAMLELTDALLSCSTFVRGDEMGMRVEAN